MIDVALPFLRDQVNAYIKSKIGTDNVVVLTRVVNEAGQVIIPTDSVGLTLVNMEEERVNKDQRYFTKTTDGTVTRINPELHLNLYLLLTLV